MAHAASIRPVAETPRLGINQQLGKGTPSTADLLQSYLTYSDFFHDVEVFPEGDVRDRFLRPRALRARYVERLVRGYVRAWDDLESEVNGKQPAAKDPEYQKRFDTVMIGLDEALTRYSMFFSPLLGILPHLLMQSRSNL